MGLHTRLPRSLLIVAACGLAALGATAAWDAGSAGAGVHAMTPAVTVAGGWGAITAIPGDTALGNVVSASASAAKTLTVTT